MTSIPEVPGAGAVCLYREEAGQGLNRSTTVYMRIKVLNESGKDYANVELPSGGESEIKYDNIAGRTIHRDGTIVPFTGKPYEKLIEKDHGYKYTMKLFSLPAVEVGSIIEYRYKRTTEYEMAPDWYVQRDLFVRKAHYSWEPAGASNIAWTPILPAEVKVIEGKNRRMTLDVENIAPQPKDEMMPPLDSVSYRVLFYYTRYKSADEFWTEQGQIWSKALDEFMGPSKTMRAAVAGMVSPGDSDEQKLHKIYCAVMAMENTDFTRKLSEREAKAKGLKDVTSTDGILARRAGSGNQLAVLFASMVRAAGMKAYLMRVADRSERVFLAGYLNLDQLDDYIVIVNVNGVETYFDPGQRYTRYARLAWYHTYTTGLRQTDAGTRLDGTREPDYRENRTTRVAEVILDQQGGAKGRITVTYAGDRARHWRQVALEGDGTSLRADLKSELTDVLPAGLEVQVSNVGDLTDPEKPLAVDFEFHGSIGSSTGKRLLVPADLFEAQVKPRFPNEKREVQVDMRYGSLVQDAVRYTIPAGMKIESAPGAQRLDIKGEAAFNSSSKQDAKTVTLLRDIAMAHVIFTVAEYPLLRGFYKGVEARDQESVIFTRDTASAEKATSGN